MKREREREREKERRKAEREKKGKYKRYLEMELILVRESFCNKFLRKRKLISPLSPPSIRKSVCVREREECVRKCV